MRVLCIALLCVGCAPDLMDAQFTCSDGLCPDDFQCCDGVCRPACDTDAGERDAGSVDAGDVDGGMDAGGIDGGAIDGGGDDAGGLDAGSGDGGPCPETCQSGESCLFGTCVPDGEVRSCEPCNAQQQCAPGLVCASESGRSTAHCVPGAMPGCPARLFVRLVNAVLAEGGRADACFPRMGVSCEAVNQYGDSCTGTTCSGPGSVCAAGRCTFGCDLAQECPGTESCSAMNLCI